MYRDASGQQRKSAIKFLGYVTLEKRRESRERYTI